MYVYNKSEFDIKFLKLELKKKKIGIELKQKIVILLK